MGVATLYHRIPLASNATFVSLRRWDLGSNAVSSVGSLPLQSLKFEPGPTVSKGPLHKPLKRPWEGLIRYVIRYEKGQANYLLLLTEAEFVC
jgi:hypothetical protein